MQPDLFNNRLANWVLIVATVGSLCVAGCGQPKFDLLAEVNKRFPVQTEKIEVQSVSIKSDSIPTGAASIAAGETAVVSKGAEITILAEVSEREWGLSNALRVWDEPLPIVNLPQQPSALGNTGSPPFLLEGDYRLWYERSGVGVRFRMQAKDGGHEQRQQPAATVGVVG